MSLTLKIIENSVSIYKNKKQCFVNNTYSTFVFQLPYTWKVESNNGIAMKKPELDIPESGWVPSHVQVFRLKMPCTGVVSSEVHVLLTINITAVNRKHGDVSLVFHRNKICLKTTDMLLDSLIGNDNIILISITLLAFIPRNNQNDISEAVLNHIMIILF